jgi:hypothetical protein
MAAEGVTLDDVAQRNLDGADARLGLDQRLLNGTADTPGALGPAAPLAVAAAPPAR